MAAPIVLATIVPIVPIVLLAINGWTIVRFRQDKRAALAGVRRVPERDLLMLAAIGGTPGAYLARHMFRHKTRKQPFSDRLHCIAVVQVGATIGLWLAG